MSTAVYAEGGETIDEATVIDSLPYTDTGDTSDNIDDYDEVCPFSGATAPDVVYAYTPAQDEVVVIDLCASGYDTKVYVYDTPNPPGGDFVACNDDNGAVCGPGFRSYLPDTDDPVVALTAGVEYYIVVDGYGSASGAYDLSIEALVTGACCLPDGSCQVLDNAACTSLGGEFQGEDTACECIGDIDGNGTVDVDDLLLLLAAWGDPDPGDADLDGDGDVDVDDLLLLLADWGCEGVVCVPCVDCDDTEGEPTCGPDYVDEYNGGCNSDPFVFQAIACGEVVCGGSGTFVSGGNDSRDTDWFEYVADEPFIYTWEVTSNFPLLIFILDGNGGCDNPDIVISSATADPCATASLTSECLAPGTYWFWVGPSIFGSGVDCETAQYIAELSCEPCGIPTGACCFPDGSCEDGLFEDECLNAGGSSWFEDQDCVDVDCPSTDCPPEGILENEPDCGENYEDMWNGGCNSDPFVFQPIACGEIICGKSGTFLFDGSNYRDTDWFEYVADEPFIYTWDVIANFPLRTFIISAPCPGTILTTAFADPFVPTSLSSECLSPGTYWFWVGPDVFTGVDCAMAAYVAELTCEPCEIPTGACCLPEGCEDGLFEGECFGMGGLLWFENQLCADVECPVALNGADLCEDATAIMAPAAVFGDTTNATFDDVGFCGTSNTAPGVWYAVEGTGGMMVATTCTAFFDYDTKISVFEGSCNDLICVGGNDDNCTDGASGLLSTVEWSSTEGTTYLVLVHGFSSGVGEFLLLVE